MRRRLLLLALVLWPVVGCECLTSASEYRVFQGLCDECPSSADDLRRPPCPPPSPSDRPDGGDSQHWMFAWRHLSLGGAFDGGDYSDGYDQDCSVRAPHGEPVLCA